MTNDRAKAVLVTGAVGSGKTTLVAEVGEILGGRGIATAVIDLDWLGWFHAPADRPVDVHELIARNLSALWPSFRDAGATHAALARFVHSRAEVETLRRAIPDVDVIVARVVVPDGIVAERLRRRDTGVILEGHLVEAREMTRLLDEAEVEDLQVVNDERPIRAVATELIARLGWA